MTSLDPITPERLTAIKARIERAHTEIGEVASHGPHRRFRMSVPSRPDRDTDLIISDALKGAEELLSEVDRLKVRVRKLEAEAAREELITGSLIDERDRMHALLDKFAYQVAPIEVIGEHSSGNDPWENAFDLLTPAATVDRLTCERDKAVEAVKHTAGAMLKVATAMQAAIRLAGAVGAVDVVATLNDALMDTDVLPDSQDGGDR